MEGEGCKIFLFPDFCKTIKREEERLTKGREMPLSRSPSTTRTASLPLDPLPSTPSSSSSTTLAMHPLHASHSHPHPSGDRRLPPMDFSPSATLMAMQRGGSRSHSSSSQAVHEDPFHNLRKHNLVTKEAWTAIPSSEGFRILELCRSMSATSSEPVCYVLGVTFLEEPLIHEREKK